MTSMKVPRNSAKRALSPAATVSSRIHPSFHSRFSVCKKNCEILKFVIITNSALPQFGRKLWCYSLVLGFRATIYKPKMQYPLILLQYCRGAHRLSKLEILSDFEPLSGCIHILIIVLQIFLFQHV